MIHVDQVLRLVRRRRRPLRFGSRPPADRRVIPRTEVKALITRIDELERAVREHRREVRAWGSPSARADERLWGVLP